MKKGDMIACINDKFAEAQKRVIPNRPVKGQIYTVRDIMITRYGTGVKLVEITNPLLTEGNFSFEPNFGKRRFKKLIDSEFKVELSVDEKILAV